MADPHRDQDRDQVLDDRPGIVVVGRCGERGIGVGVGERHAGLRPLGAARGLKLPALDQDRADRPADQAAADDSADRDCDRDGRRADDTRLLEERGECEAGRRATRERHGSRQHAKERVQPEADRDQDADDVLDDRKHGREQEEPEDLWPADLQQRQARAESDGREERDHQRALQGRIEFDERQALAVGDENCDRHEQSAEYRRRQVVSIEDRNEAAEPMPAEEGNAGEGEGVDQV